jgi:hypothetical protein
MRYKKQRKSTNVDHKTSMGRVTVKTGEEIQT